MIRASEILGTFPGGASLDRDLIARCIEACVSCAHSCTVCADADLSEQDVAHMRKCIRTCLDCADVCETTSRVVARQTSYDPNVTRVVLQACIEVCKACGDECANHAAMHVHCRICEEDCRRCEQACRELLNAVR
jgi:uncharacterized membrane protein